MSVGDYLGRLVWALPLVLVLLGGVLTAIKRGWLRLPLLAPPAGGATKLVQSIGVAPGQRLLVIEFEGARLLVGSHRGGLVALDRREGAR